MFFGRVAGMVAYLSRPCSLLPEIQILKLAEIADKKSRRDIWRTVLAGKRTELLNCVFIVLNRFTDA